jgi:DNA polymerase IV
MWQVSHISNQKVKLLTRRPLQPFDLEDDEDTFHHSAPEDSDSDPEDYPGDLTRPLNKPKTWQDNFQCMEKNDGSRSGSNPNAETIAILEQMSEFYDRVNDHWRTLAYRKAITSLKKQPERIIYKKDAAQLPYVGARIASKIEEIALTHGLRRLDNARLDPMDQVLQVFMRIYGVGISQASRWVNQGFRTLDDLTAGAKLTANQIVGIEHYDDLQERIPRAEVEKHGAIVREALQKIDSGFQVTIGGSYRRGANSSGDIDLIITKPDTNIAHIRNIILENLIPHLSSIGVLTVALAKSHAETGSKWHGCSKLPTSPTWRRIDLLLVPWDEMGAALIYFTGNDIFNRSIRLLASKKGMRLNQRGLFMEVMRGQGRVKITEGELLEGKDERKIFSILGVPWRPPEHRIC